MRILLGPLNRQDHRAVVGDLAGLDVVVFDRHDADVTFDPARESLTALWSRLPAGWRPDVLVWWSPEYTALPEGLERCPVPSAAVLGDWNLGIWSTAPLLEAFDLVLTDRRGVEVLAPQLGVPVRAWPAFSFDRERHRRDPVVERDIDVLFVGNMNHHVQAERTPWLARLARLGDRHRVVMASGVYGEAYAALLRRARIVWNRSIRGEMNMRAYEAPACGALLFMEADNAEVRDVFADGVSCALYDEVTLERRIDEYLAAPERLARVAEAGWRRVQSETYLDHLARLATELSGLRTGARPFTALPAWRRDYWLALHALSCADSGGVAAAMAHLARALQRTDDQPTVAAALGALSATAVAYGVGERDRTLDQAAQFLSLGLRAHPADVISRANFAWVSGVRGRYEVARAEWHAVHEMLAAGRPFPVDRLVVPPAFDAFRTRWEQASLLAGLEERMAAFRPLLAARASAALAALEETPDGAVDRWTESLVAWPGIDDNVRRLAEALDVAGHGDVASAAWARVLELNPFDHAARASAMALAARRGDDGAAMQLAAEAERLAAVLRVPDPAIAAEPVAV